MLRRSWILNSFPLNDLKAMSNKLALALAEAFKVGCKRRWRFELPYYLGTLQEQVQRPLGTVPFQKT